MYDLFDYEGNLIIGGFNQFHKDQNIIFYIFILVADGSRSEVSGAYIAVIGMKVMVDGWLQI